MHLFMRWNDYKAFFSSLTFELPVALAKALWLCIQHIFFFSESCSTICMSGDDVRQKEFFFRVILGETIWHYTILSLYSFIFLPFFFVSCCIAWKKNRRGSRVASIVVASWQARAMRNASRTRGIKSLIPSAVIIRLVLDAARLCNIFLLQSSLFFLFALSADCYGHENNSGRGGAMEFKSARQKKQRRDCVHSACMP